MAVIPSLNAGGKSKQTSTTMAFPAENSAMPSGMLSTDSKNGEVSNPFEINTTRERHHMKNNRSDSLSKELIKPKIIMRQKIFDQDNFNSKAIASHDLLRQSLIRSSEVKHQSQEMKNSVNTRLKQDVKDH